LTLLTLLTGEGQSIGDIVSVHYGQPKTGICGCPGSDKFAKIFDAALPPDPTFPQTCGSDYPFTGVEPISGARCCAKRQTQSKEADLSNLVFRDGDTCFSPPRILGNVTVGQLSGASGDSSCDTAASGDDATGKDTFAYGIVASSCLGKGGCAIPVSDLTSFSNGSLGYCTPPPPPTNLGDRRLSSTNSSNSTHIPQVVSLGNKSGAYFCGNALGSRLEGCSSAYHGNGLKKLSVVVTCADTSITLYGVVIPKNTVWVILTLTDIGQCLFVMIMVWILRNSEEGNARDMASSKASIELFTLFLPRVRSLAADPVFVDQKAEKARRDSLKQHLDDLDNDDDDDDDDDEYHGSHVNRSSSSRSLRSIKAERTKITAELDSLDPSKTETHRMVDANKLSLVLKHHFETVLAQVRPVISDAKMGYSDKEALEYEAQKKWPVKVADVQFGRNDGAVLRLQRLRGHLLHELQHETAHLEHHHGDFSEKALNGIEAHVHKELDRLEALDEKIAALQSRPDVHNPACAFVTLETREAKLRALAAYPRSTLFYCCCQIKPSECCCCLEKRIRAELPALDAAETAEEGKAEAAGEEGRSSKYLQDASSGSKPPPLYRLWLSTLTPAPENIMWQNLTIGRASRCFRVSLSCLITVVLLLATIGGSILVKNQTLKMSREYPSVDCAALTKAVAIDKLTGEPTGTGITLEDALLDEMQIERINATTFEPKNVKLSLLGCYCSENIQDIYSTEFVPAAFNISTSKYPVPEGYVENGLFGFDYRKTWCVKWLVDSTQKQGFQIASVLIIVLVNVTLKMVMKRLVNMEAPISQSQFSESLMTKLTIFQFMNTALVTMLVNANLNDFSTGEADLTLNGLLFNGDYSDISKSWHVYIGTALLLSEFGAFAFLCCCCAVSLYFLRF
jgi:hypothetical protein